MSCPKHNFNWKKLSTDSFVSDDPRVYKPVSYEMLVANNYLQQLCREIIEFLFTEGSWDLQNIMSVATDILQAKLVNGTQGEEKKISWKSCCAQFYRLLE